MTPAELERLMAERPVSTEVVEAFRQELMRRGAGTSWDARACLQSAYRADVPALVRALETTVRAAQHRPCADCANDALAAFWAAYSEEEA